MSGGELRLKSTSDNSQLLQAIGEANKQIVNLEKQLEKTSAKSKKLSQEEAELNRQRKRALEEIATPEERHVARLTQLGTLLNRAKLTTDEYQRAVSKVNQEYSQATHSAAETGNTMVRAFGPAAKAMIAGLAGAGGVAALAKAWGLVKDEIEAAFKAHQRAAQATMPLAEAQRVALGNLGTADAAQIGAFREQAKAAAQEIGVSETDFYRTVSAPLSARGDLSVETALRATKAGLRISPGDVGTATSYAGAALDLSKISGATPEQSAGFLQAAGVAMRVSDPEKQARALAPALTAAMANQATMQSGAALFGALTVGSADVTGEQSKTAMIKFVRSLHEFMPQESTMEGRISRLQADPKMREAFLGKYSFEAAAQTPIEEILAGKGAAARAYGQYLSTIPSPDQAAVTAAQLQTNLAAIPEQQTAAIKRRWEAAKEEIRVANQVGARGAITTEDLAEVLIDTGSTKMGAELRQFASKSADKSLDASLKFLEARGRGLTLPRESRFVTDPMSGAYDPVMTYPSQEEMAQGASILNLVKTVREINAGPANAGPANAGPASAGPAGTQFFTPRTIPLDEAQAIKASAEPRPDPEMAIQTAAINKQTEAVEEGNDLLRQVRDNFRKYGLTRPDPPMSRASSAANLANSE